MAGHRLFAAIYDTINSPLERRVLAEHRAGLVANLPGTVLDIGAGTGANLRHFRAAIKVSGPDSPPAATPTAPPAPRSNKPASPSTT